MSAQVEDYAVSKNVVESFVKSLRTEKTKTAYLLAFKTVLGDRNPVWFVELAAKDRRKAEDVILNWLSENKERYKGSTTRLNIAGLKSLCEYAELPIPLNWKKILKAPLRISKAKRESQLSL